MWCFENKWIWPDTNHQKIALSLAFFVQNRFFPSPSFATLWLSFVVSVHRFYLLNILFIRWKKLNEIRLIFTWFLFCWKPLCFSNDTETKRNEKKHSLFFEQSKQISVYNFVTLELQSTLLHRNSLNVCICIWLPFELIWI